MRIEYTIYAIIDSLGSFIDSQVLSYVQGFDTLEKAEAAMEKLKPQGYVILKRYFYEENR